MNDIEISIIRSWLDNKSIEQIAKEHKLYQSQVAEILEKVCNILEKIGIAERINLRKIPKTYKTDEYDF
jgi:hypothetical protein